MPKWEDYKSEAKARGALAMELFVVRTRPTGDMGLVKATLPGDMMEAEGMIIYRATNLEAARALANGDPMHKVGARSYDIRKWLVNEGSLSFTVALSSQSVTVN